MSLSEASQYASIASVFVTIVIACQVWQSGRRKAQRDEHRLWRIDARSQRDRRDRIYGEMRDSRDAKHLRLLIGEARTTWHKPSLNSPAFDERLIAERIYAANPATRLLSYRHDLASDVTEMHREIAQSALESLADRYDSSDLFYARQDLAGLTEVALAVNADHWLVARYVVGRARDGEVIGHRVIHDILEKNVDAAGDYLSEILRDVPMPSRLNILAGVSSLIATKGRSFGPGNSEDGPHPALHGYAMLLQRGAFSDIGKFDGSSLDFTMLIPEAIAFMVKALGIAAKPNDWVTMRALEGLPGVLNSFEPSSYWQGGGPIPQDLIDGVQMLRQKYDHPPLVNQTIKAAERLIGGPLPSASMNLASGRLVLSGWASVPAISLGTSGDSRRSGPCARNCRSLIAGLRSEQSSASVACRIHRKASLSRDRSTTDGRHFRPGIASS